ncbi:MAG: hypothetical protein ACRDZ7_00780 [Acidimicrobiia bacterium]
MINYCPRCGAAFQAEIMGEWIRANIRCPDCRLAITEVPAMLAPSDDEVGYELDDWPVSDRGAVSAALGEADIPFRWEEGLVLVVPAPVEEQVDALLDGVQAEASGAVNPDDALAEEGDFADDGGEEAQAAMADVFVAADRLQHEPFDKGAADDLATAAAVVEASPPPFGIDRQMWRQIADRASAITGQLEAPDSDGDAVAQSARELRDFLREYV